MCLAHSGCPIAVEQLNSHNAPTPDEFAKYGCKGTELVRAPLTFYKSEDIMANLRKGSKVTWIWDEHEAHGKVVDRFTARVTRTLQGAKVVREASKEHPAYLILQTDGDHVLKLDTELRRAG
jgi:DUF2945 family protein